MTTTAMPARARTPRFFCENLPHPRLGETRCALDPDQTRHARKVLRIEEGETVELFNGQGLTATATVMVFDAGIAWCQVVQAEEHPEPSPIVVVASAVPKGPRVDDMVAQLSQLGADVFVPLIAERSVVDPRESKIDRLRKLATESSKQCGRAWLLKVTEPIELGALLQEPCDLGLVLDPRAAVPPALPEKLRGAERVMLVIGPEGGLTPQELQAADNAGYLPWTIGPHVMRIETAAAAAAGVVRYLTA